MSADEQRQKDIDLFSRFVIEGDVPYEDVSKAIARSIPDREEVLGLLLSQLKREIPEVVKEAMNERR